jgi:glycerol kinase
MKKYILAIDQGTTGSRAFIFDAKAKVIGSAYQEFPQYYPQPGWVEHDADEIWQSCVSVIRGAIRKAKISPQQIAAIGITNQRETTVLWDRATSKPVGRAIVWQCRRTAVMCESLQLKKHLPAIRKKTGLVLDAYFSGTKIKWMLDHNKNLRRRAKSGQICFGTIDSWLIWKLTGGQAHVTDMTNASRTLIFNIRDKKWDPELLKAFDIPAEILPTVQPSGSIFGHANNKETGLIDIPIAGVMGDQQSALYGQGCHTGGTSKNTYGTGCFLVLNTADRFILSHQGLLTTLACDVSGKPVYALEGSVFIAGAVVQWLRDELQVIKNSSQTEDMVKGLKDTNGVYVVPAFAGLGAPYWDSGARGIVTGLTRGANRRHVVRAALESIAYQTKDVFDLFEKEFGRKALFLNVDGGACQNDFLMQFQADILRCRIIRPAMIDTTAKGAALLAGVTVGLWNPKHDLKKLQKVEKVFSPQLSTAKVKELYSGWQKAVRQARAS